MSRMFNAYDEGSSYDYNPYSNPGRCGLEMFAELSSEYAGSYEFDYLCVWVDTATGGLLAARDSGCSCPTPFEDYRETGQMVEVRSWQDIEGLVGSDGGGFDSAERFALRRNVESYLSGMALANAAVEAFCAEHEPSPHKVRPFDAIIAGTVREEELLEQIADLELTVANSRQMLDEYLTVIRAQGELIQSVRLAVRP